MSGAPVQYAANGNGPMGMTTGPGQGDPMDSFMGLSVQNRRDMLLGPGNKLNTTQVEDAYSVDMRTEAFAQAYSGGNTVVRELIIEQIKGAALFPIQVLLPQR